MLDLERDWCCWLIIAVGSCLLVLCSACYCYGGRTVIMVFIIIVITVIKSAISRDLY